MILINISDNYDGECQNKAAKKREGNRKFVPIMREKEKIPARYARTLQKEIEKSEVASNPFIFCHVPDRIEVDQRPNPGHHQGH